MFPLIIFCGLMFQWFCREWKWNWYLMKVKSGISHRWPLSRPAHMRCVARLGCNINFFIINHHHHRRHHHHHHHHQISLSPTVVIAKVFHKNGECGYLVCVFSRTKIRVWGVLAICITHLIELNKIPWISDLFYESFILIHTYNQVILRSEDIGIARRGNLWLMKVFY